MMTVIASQPDMRTFAGSPDQVRHARDFVRHVLGQCPVSDDVILLSSELVTNAVLHTASGLGGKVIVTVYRSDVRVRVEVADDGSAGTPRTRPDGRAGESGLGLNLVELVSRRWGHDGETTGRVVWFEMEW